MLLLSNGPGFLTTIYSDEFIMLFCVVSDGVVVSPLFVANEGVTNINSEN